ncbi:B-type lectin plumieribetin-like [Pungitius pungitius]|uniref:B-type lectin plumieribetin-like n=1 Tax=Pungitius pungitius TaxID=134920 RepID=UPI002E165E67
MSKNYLSKNDELRKGDFLVSNNREWKAVFQEDGNFVLYGWKPASPKWHTNSYRPTSNMCRLHLTDEGKLVVSREGEEVWNSGENEGMT